MQKSQMLKRTLWGGKLFILAAAIQAIIGCSNGGGGGGSKPLVPDPFTDRAKFAATLLNFIGATYTPGTTLRFRLELTNPEQGRFIYHFTGGSLPRSFFPHVPPTEPKILLAQFLAHRVTMYNNRDNPQTNGQSTGIREIPLTVGAHDLNPNFGLSNLGRKIYPAVFGIIDDPSMDYTGFIDIDVSPFLVSIVRTSTSGSTDTGEIFFGGTLLGSFEIDFDFALGRAEVDLIYL